MATTTASLPGEIGHLLSSGTVLGKGTYSTVYLHEGKAVKVIARTPSASTQADYASECAMHRIGERVAIPGHFELLPALLASREETLSDVLTGHDGEDGERQRSKHRLVCTMALEAYETTLQTWFLQRNTEREVATVLLEVLARMRVLAALGVRHNDLFLRNIMVRRRRAANDPKKYSFNSQTAITFNPEVDVALIDFGLVSVADDEAACLEAVGQSPMIRDSRRRTQFMPKKQRLETQQQGQQLSLMSTRFLKTHPLEQSLTSRQHLLIDELCLYISFVTLVNHSRQCGGLVHWLQHFRACLQVALLDGRISRAALLTDLVKHPFLAQLDLGPIIPGVSVALHHGLGGA